MNPEDNRPPGRQGEETEAGFATLKSTPLSNMYEQLFLLQFCLPPSLNMSQLSLPVRDKGAIDTNEGSARAIEMVRSLYPEGIITLHGSAGSGKTSWLLAMTETLRKSSQDLQLAYLFYDDLRQEYERVTMKGKSDVSWSRLDWLNLDNFMFDRVWLTQKRLKKTGKPYLVAFESPGFGLREFRGGLTGAYIHNEFQAKSLTGVVIGNSATRTNARNERTLMTKAKEEDVRNQLAGRGLSQEFLDPNNIQLFREIFGRMANNDFINLLWNQLLTLAKSDAKDYKLDLKPVQQGELIIASKGGIDLREIEELNWVGRYWLHRMDELSGHNLDSLAWLIVQALPGKVPPPKFVLEKLIEIDRARRT